MRRKTILAAALGAAAVVTAGAVAAAALWPFSVQPEHYDGVQTEPIDAQATAPARALLAYLGRIYGSCTLSGQYINEYEDFDAPAFRADENDPNSPRTVFRSNELQAVYSVTGKYPALLGLDLSGTECGNRCYSVEQAIEWHNAGGIVTICWHWLVDNFDGKPRAFYTEETDFDLAAALQNRDSAQYKGLLADIDRVAESLQALQQAGVPVLWRPLHEAAGGWFWWGASGSRAYKALWDLLYDRLTNVHGLHNLLWVYNGQDPAWYVGDDKCDLIGDDPYYDNNSRAAYEKDPANRKRFLKNYKTSRNKMIAMTENDFVPDVDLAYAQNVRWLTFCTWCREFVCEMDGTVTTPVYGAPFTTHEELRAAYDDDRVLTLDELAASGYDPA